MTVTLPYPPSANLYWRHNRGRTHLSAEARDYRQSAARIAAAAGLRPLKGNVALTLLIYRPARRGDLDNSLKVLIDSLRGIAYEDDKQIVDIHAKRFDDKYEPRVELSVSITGKDGARP